MTNPTGIQSPQELIREEEEHLLGGMWMLLQQCTERGRLDAAGLDPNDIKKMINELYDVLAAVVNVKFARAAEAVAE